MAGKKQMSIQAKGFCKYYIECHGNGTDAYIKAYGIKNRDSARKGASRLLKNPEIEELINDFVKEEGLNDVFVDLELKELIKQDDNKVLKLNAIKEYNKLNRRGIHDKSAYRREEIQEEEREKERKRQEEEANSLSIEKMRNMTPIQLDALRRKLLGE